MGTDEFHYLLGKYVSERGRQLKLKDSSVLATAYECGIPMFTSSPGDSSIGMNVAAMAHARFEVDSRCESRREPDRRDCLRSEI